MSVLDNPSPAHIRLKLDDLDTKIVQLLHKDGRMAYTEIAKQVGVAEATVRYRVQRLTETGAITIQAYLNPDKLGYRHIALISLNLQDLSQADALAQELASLDSVSYVAFVAGQYDLCIEITYESHAGLLDFLTQIRQRPGVTASETQIVLKLLKSQYSFQVNQLSEQSTEG